MGTQENDTEIPHGSQVVEKQVVSEGKTGWHPSFPTPKIVKDVTDGIIYFCAGCGGVVGATDLFTGYQAKVIGLVLSCVIIACGAIQKGIGVKPSE